MAIATYNDLVEKIIRWSHRKDILDEIPDFISLAETEMFANDEEVLKIRPIEKTSTATLVGTPPNETRFLALPDGFIEQRDFRITVNDDLIPLKYEQPHAMIVYDGVSRPTRFTVTNQIEFNIVADQDYTVTMKYTAKPDALTSTNQTNAILTSDPNIYLYGALHQVFTWSLDDDQALKYWGKFINAIKGANQRARKGRFGPAPSMKIRGCTP